MDCKFYKDHTWGDWEVLNVTTQIRRCTLCKKVLATAAMPYIKSKENH